MCALPSSVTLWAPAATHRMKYHLNLSLAAFLKQSRESAPSSKQHPDLTKARNCYVRHLCSSFSVLQCFSEERQTYLADNFLLNPDLFWKKRAHSRVSFGYSGKRCLQEKREQKPSRLLKSTMKSLCISWCVVTRCVWMCLMSMQSPVVQITILSVSS